MNLKQAKTIITYIEALHELEKPSVLWENTHIEEEAVILDQQTVFNLRMNVHDIDVLVLDPTGEITHSYTKAR